MEQALLALAGERGGLLPKIFLAWAVMSDHKRLLFLDAQRGVAITLVVLFHAYVRWSQIVPFGPRFAAFPVFAYGWLGVDLFFLISGFVIFMTLEKCSNFRDFAFRRWLRLFPAMLVCSLFLLVTAPLFPERPLGPASLRDLLPGLTFIEPEWWGRLLHSPQGVIDGSLWSIFVEVKFYAIFGFLYFTLGGGAATAALLVLAGLWGALEPVARSLGLDFPGLSVLRTLMEAASLRYFGWFAAGALYYRYFRYGNSRVLGAAVLASLASVAMLEVSDPVSRLAALVIVAFFTVSIVSQAFQAALGNRLLLLLGMISYPLYLLHQNLMVAATVKLGRAAPWLPGILMPALPITLLVLLGWIVAVRLEGPLRRALKASLGRVGQPAAVDSRT